MRSTHKLQEHRTSMQLLAHLKASEGSGDAGWVQLSGSALLGNGRRPAQSPQSKDTSG